MTSGVQRDAALARRHHPDRSGRRDEGSQALHHPQRAERVGDRHLDEAHRADLAGRHVALGDGGVDEEQIQGPWGQPLRERGELIRFGHIHLLDTQPVLGGVGQIVQPGPLLAPYGLDHLPAAFQELTGQAESERSRCADDQCGAHAATAWSTAGFRTSSHHCRKVVGLAVWAVRATPSSSPSSLARIMSTMPWTIAWPIP